MKKIIIFLIMVSFSACNMEKGNYDYADINIVTIDDDLFKNKTYEKYTSIDSLIINPIISNSIDNSNKSYKWEVLNLDVKNAKRELIGSQRDLKYFITIPTGKYKLYFTVIDNNTQLKEIIETSLIVRNKFSRGWVILGENNDGKAQLDMISIGEDSIILRNISPEVSKMEKPLRVWLPTDDTKFAEITVSTQSGSINLDRNTLTTNDLSDFKNMFFDQSVISDCIIADIAQISYFNRAAIIDGDFFFTGQFNMSAQFANPCNRYAESYNQKFKVGGLLSVGYGKKPKAYIIYDDTNKQFASIKDSDVECEKLADKASDITIFSWQTGYDYVTTINTRQINNASYTILKDKTNNYYLYSYSVNSNRLFVKNAKYKMEKLIDFDKAVFYGASSVRSIIYYSVDAKLYGYDFINNKTTLLEDFDTQNNKSITITDLHFDLQNEYGFNSDNFYVSIYDSNKEVDKGGSLLKYSIIDDPNEIKIKRIETSCWNNLCKIKSIVWKPN